MRGSLTTRLCLLTGALVVIGMMIHAFGAATIDHATITEVVHDVSILDPNSRKASPAEVSGVFEVPQIMKTGGDSRSEMISTDRTITRVGADTLFSFEPRSRTINLQEGSLLFQSQPGNGGGTIRTAAVTAAVLGTTIIVAATKDGGFKLLVLEGTGYVRMPNGKHATVHAGQMIFVPPGGETLGPVLEFRLLDEVATSDLVMGFKTRLPSWRKIQREILLQEKLIAEGEYLAPGLVVGGIIDPNTRINGTRPHPTPPQQRHIFTTTIITVIPPKPPPGGGGSPPPSGGP